MRFNRKIELKADKGPRVEVDLSDLDLTPEQHRALDNLLWSGRLDALDPRERDLLKDVRARVGTGTPGELASAIIVRFDLEWVTID